MSHVAHPSCVNSASSHPQSASGVVCAADTAVRGKKRVVTLVEPNIRSKLDLVAHQSFDTIHTDSIDAAYHEMNAIRSGTLLLSPTAVRSTEFTAIGRLLRDYPGASTVAVIGERSANVESALLMLGAYGVRTVVNLSRPDGFTTLRDIVAKCDNRVGRAILAAFQPVFQDFPPRTRMFFASVILAAPTTPNAQALCRAMHVDPSTMASRFFRYRLPALKTYLKMFRLLYVAGLFTDSSVSMARVADQLLYSSPQALSRHFQIVLGVTSTEFRAKWTFSRCFRHVVGELFTPYYKTLCSFVPVSTTEHVSAEALHIAKK